MIGWMRDEDFAIIYASDSTATTKLDKLCKNVPDMYQVIEETKVVKSVVVMINLWSVLEVKKREISKEPGVAAGKRMHQYQASKNA